MVILRMINIKRGHCICGDTVTGPPGEAGEWGRARGGKGGEDAGAAGGHKLYLSTVATLLQWLHLPLDTSVATLGFSGKSIKTTEI